MNTLEKVPSQKPKLPLQETRENKAEHTQSKQKKGNNKKVKSQ